MQRTDLDVDAFLAGLESPRAAELRALDRLTSAELAGQRARELAPDAR
jgi:hypothetical protein